MLLIIAMLVDMRLRLKRDHVDEPHTGESLLLKARRLHYHAADLTNSPLDDRIAATILINAYNFSGFSGKINEKPMKNQ